MSSDIPYMQADRYIVENLTTDKIAGEFDADGELLPFRFIKSPSGGWGLTLSLHIGPVCVCYADALDESMRPYRNLFAEIVDRHHQHEQRHADRISKKIGIGAL